jgi:hypothetical protein
MRILLPLAAAAAVMCTAAAANAASMMFQFDPAASSVTITNQGSGLCAFCSVTPNLDTPFPTLTINEGDTQGFDFADFDFSGLGGFETGVQVSATLAFTSPNVGPASTTGNAWYATVLGFVSAGQLTWNSIAPITTSDGSQFTVSFQNLSGIGGHSVTDQAYITVDHVGGVPEPASWALMIGGFGMAGAMLRRRRLVMAA